MEPIVNPEIKIDKRTKEYKDSVQDRGEDAPAVDVTTTLPTQEAEGKVDYSKKENNPGFKLCMRCGDDLEYNDDGSAKRRVQPELCHECIWRNNGTKNPERT